MSVPVIKKQISKKAQPVKKAPAKKVAENVEEKVVEE